MIQLNFSSNIVSSERFFSICARSARVLMSSNYLKSGNNLSYSSVSEGKNTAA